MSANRTPTEMQNTIPPWRQLRWSLVLSFIWLTVLPMVIISVVVIQQSTHQAEKQVYSQLESVATLKEQELQGWLKNGQNELQLVALDIAEDGVIFDLLQSSPENPNLQASVNTAMIQAQDVTDYFQEFLAYTADGHVVAASNRTQIGKWVSLKPYYANSLLNEQFIHPPYYEIGTGDLTMFETIQIVNDRGTLVGVLAGRLDLGTLNDVMSERAGLGKTGQTYLVSLENNLLLTDSGLDDRSRAYRSDGIAQALHQRNGSDQYTDYAGVEVLGVYHWIPDLQAGLMAEQSVDEALTAAHESRRYSILIGVLATLLAATTGFVLATRLARPIHTLTQSVAALQQDVWSVEVPLPTRMDEVGRLTLAYIQMRNKIQDLITSLEDRIQHLEATEAALATSEQKYRGFFEQAFEGIRLVDRDGIIREWNPSSERITGISASEAIGEPLWKIQGRMIPDSLVTPEITDQMRLDFDQYFPINEPQPPRHILMRRIMRPDGTIRYIDNIIFPIITDKEVYYGGIVRDITEQKEDQDRIEQHVRKLEAMQRIAVAMSGTIKLDEVLDILVAQLVNLIPNLRASIMLMVDGQLRFVKWRGLPENMSWDIEPLIKPEKYLRNKGLPVIFPDVQQTAEWNIVSDVDAQVRSWMGIPVIHRGTLLGVLNLDHQDPNFFTDDHAQLGYAVAQQAGITIANAQLFEDLEGLVRARTRELAVEQERSNIILQNVADAIVFTDKDGYILYVNAAWEKLNGYTSEEVRGQRSSLIQSGETPVAIYQAMWLTINSGKMWRGDLRNRRKDGSIYVAELLIVPVHSADGVVQHFVGVQRDVTALRELDALKERFVADAAHDLGNPVAVLNTSLYMLRLSPNQIEQRLPVLEYQVKRLDALVKDLLTISQLDREAELMDTAPVQFLPLVHQVVQGQQLLAGQKQIHLTADLPDDLPTVLGDFESIERVIVNLVANALAYTPDGGQVHVQVSRQHGEVIFSVKDTGIGISPSELGRIFDRFYRTPSARRKTAGTGLGLPIVKKIVELHSGRIEVESEEGKGSEFRVYLPIRS